MSFHNTCLLYKGDAPGTPRHQGETRRETLPRAPVQGVTLRPGSHLLTHRDDRNKTQTEKPQTAEGKQGEAGTDKLLTALWRGRRSVWGQTPHNRDKHSCVGPPASSQQARSVEAEQPSQSTGQLPGQLAEVLAGSLLQGCVSRSALGEQVTLHSPQLTRGAVCLYLLEGRISA